MDRVDDMPATRRKRNPGPPWGFKIIRFWDWILPQPLNRWIKEASGLVAMWVMPRQAKHSREYLREILGREPTFRERWKHFSTFAFYLCDRVKAAFRHPVPFRWYEGHGDAFTQLTRHDKSPILMGTFHVGYSDLMGFFTGVLGSRIHMLRLKVGNSEDTERLQRMAGDNLNIIWVNHMEDAIYSIKQVIQNGGSVGMQCDRIEYASRTEAFDFLGAKRLFPFTIYWISILFNTPVIFVIAARPDASGSTPVRTSTVFRPDPEADRKTRLQAAKLHFQEVIQLLETILSECPELWFNFEPLNPIAGPTDPQAGSAPSASARID